MEVKWIKICTDIFDDEKILLIESLPEADSIIVIWFKLLCLAGKQNNSGVFIMSNGMPYTDKMLATIFRRKETTVKLALKTFEEFGMVEITNNAVTIPNWGKHQNFDKIEERNAYMRTYMQEYRQKQKAITEGKNKRKLNSKSNSKVNVSSLDKKENKERDKIKREEEIYDIGFSDKPNEPPTAPETSKIQKHKYGEYKNILLTDDELEKWKAEAPNNWSEYIETMSGYVASTGKGYKNYLAALRNWKKRDNEKGVNQNGKNDEHSRTFAEAHEIDKLFTV